MDLFPAHSRVAFLGDSLTHVNNYASRVIAHYLRYFPEKKIFFQNFGVSGGSAKSAELYLEDDLLPFSPTHVLILLGVNDSHRGLLNDPVSEKRDTLLEEALSDYAFQMERLTNKLLSRGIQVILCTPAPYAEFIKDGDTPLNGGYALISRYAETVRNLASSLNLPVVDYHAYLSELYLKETLYNPDRVHPNDYGYWRMAECLLRTQDLTIDPFEPIEDCLQKSGLAEWASVTDRVRNLYATEWMLIGDYDAPLEHKMEIVRDYVAGECWNGFLYFEKLARDYLKDKTHQAELVKESNLRMRERIEK